MAYRRNGERGKFCYNSGTRDRLQDDPKANRDLLDHGTLYVALFDEGDRDPNRPKGRGQWLPLVHGEHGLTAANGFASQAEVLIHARQAGSQVGATRMGRPEWIAVSANEGQVSCSLQTRQSVPSTKRGAAP